MTMISLRGRSLLLAMLLWCVTPPLVAAEEPPPAGALWVLTLEGPVGPASADYLVRGLADAGASRRRRCAVADQYAGGLDSAMRQMIAAVLASPLPVICHVAPGGAGRPVPAPFCCMPAMWRPWRRPPIWGRQPRCPSVLP